MILLIIFAMSLFVESWWVPVGIYAGQTVVYFLLIGHFAVVMPNVFVVFGLGRLAAYLTQVYKRRGLSASKQVPTP